MQKIGLLGGLSWVSTAEYYRRLNELMQGQLGGVASARIVPEVGSQKWGQIEIISNFRENYGLISSILPDNAEIYQAQEKL